MINSRKDYDNASPDEQQQFHRLLASSINKWQWEGDEWIIRQNTTTISRFGFAAEDFPEAPVPPQPDYNPDEREAQKNQESIRSELDALDQRTATTREWREYIIANPNDFHSKAVERAQEIEDKAANLRSDI